MKVLFAIFAAGFLRAFWSAELAERIEAWAGIDYVPDDDKWGDTD